MSHTASLAPLGAERPRRYVFLLLDRFTMVAFAAAIEPLRLANQISGKQLYSWVLVGENGREAVCSNGARLILNAGLDEFRRDDTILICAGVDVARTATRPVLGWLRREARRGARLGALCTGARVLAETGLLNGRRATIHWEYQDGFAEDFPEVELIRSVFVEDGPFLTAAGGTAAIDLILRQIARDQGQELAAKVADQMIHTAIRNEDDQQRLSIPTRIGVRHPRLASIVARMEANLEDPVSPARLAADAGMSPRQLERLFARYLGRSPKRYYMEIRLERARNLLMQTDMSVMEIALACGFASAAHFSKCYRSAYDTTPYRQRGSRSTDDSSATFYENDFPGGEFAGGEFPGDIFPDAAFGGAGFDDEIAEDGHDDIAYGDLPDDAPDDLSADEPTAGDTRRTGALPHPHHG